MKKLISLLLVFSIVVIALPASAKSEMRTSLSDPAQSAGEDIVDQIRSINSQGGQIGKYDDKSISFVFSVEPYGAEVEAALDQFKTYAEDGTGTPAEPISLAWMARLALARATEAENMDELLSAETMFLQAVQVAPTISDYADTDTGMISNFLLGVEASSLRGAMATRGIVAAVERAEADRLYAVAKDFHKAVVANAKLATDKSSEEYSAVVGQVGDVYAAKADEYYAAAMTMLAQSRDSYGLAAETAAETAGVIGSWTPEFQKEYADSSSKATVASMEKEAAAYQKSAEMADYAWPPK